MCVEGRLYSKYPDALGYLRIKVVCRDRTVSEVRIVPTTVTKAIKQTFKADIVAQRVESFGKAPCQKPRLLEQWANSLNLILLK